MQGGGGRREGQQVELPGPSREGCGGVKRDHPKSDPRSGRKSSHLPKALGRGWSCPSGLPPSLEVPAQASHRPGPAGGARRWKLLPHQPGSRDKMGWGEGLGSVHRRWATGPGSSSPSRVQDGQRRKAAPLGNHGDGGLVPRPGPHPASRPLVASVLLLRMLRAGELLPQSRALLRPPHVSPAVWPPVYPTGLSPRQAGAPQANTRSGAAR